MPKLDILYMTRVQRERFFNEADYMRLKDTYILTPEKLRRVDQAEQLLLDLGFHQVRVRIHGEMARIEVDPGEVERLSSAVFRNRISAAFHELGFSFVAADLDGYHTGSMNRTLLKGR